MLPLDDILYAVQPTLPHLTLSSLDRRLQRHGISRLPQVEGEVPVKRKFFGASPLALGIGECSDLRQPLEHFHEAWRCPEFAM